jgi:hypothetical protein
MHLVFVGAHPDDETYASGTIAKHIANGAEAGKATGKYLQRSYANSEQVK